MKIKVIIENGVVTSVVKNSDEPVDVEIVSIDDDYSDRQALEEYRDQIYADPAYKNCTHVTTNFGNDS